MSCESLRESFRQQPSSGNRLAHSGTMCAMSTQSSLRTEASGIAEWGILGSPAASQQSRVSLPGLAEPLLGVPEVPLPMPGTQRIPSQLAGLDKKPGSPPVLPARVPSQLGGLEATGLQELNLDSEESSALSSKRTSSKKGIGEVMKEQNQPRHLKRWLTLLFLFQFSTLFVFVHRLKGWPWYDSAYFAVVSIWTVGYGDLTLDADTMSEVLFGTVWLLVSVVLFGYLAGEVVAEFMADQEKRHASKKYRGTTSCVIFGSLELAMPLIIGTIGFRALEGASWGRSWWWAIVTATTVGYGDISPATFEGKVFAVFFIPVGVGLFLSSLHSFAQIPLEHRRESVDAHLSRKNFSLDDLLDLSCGTEIQRLNLSQNDQCVTRNEFTLYLLHGLGKIEEQDLKDCQELFRELDATRNGLLTFKDLALLQNGDHSLSNALKRTFPLRRGNTMA